MRKIGDHGGMANLHEVTGKVQKVFLRGELIVDGDNWLGRAGMGLYLRRSVSGRIL